MNGRPPFLPPGAGMSAPDAVHPAVIRNIQDEIARMRQVHGGIEQAIKSMESKLAARRVPRYLEDIPGKRSAYWYVVQVLFDAQFAQGLQRSATVPISQEGPFVWHNFSCFWQITTAGDTAAEVLRAFRPPTCLPMITRAATAAIALDTGSVDFLLQFKTSSNRVLSNGTSGIPSAALWRENRPEYLAVPHWLERAETITVDATMQMGTTNAPTEPARGTLWCVFAGYQILMPIDYATAFGSLEEAV